jgi:hypothetical protein
MELTRTCHMQLKIVQYFREFFSPLAKTLEPCSNSKETQHEDVRNSPTRTPKRRPAGVSARSTIAVRGGTKQGARISTDIGAVGD